MLYDLFNEWFQGMWNNQKQAYSNPRGQAYVSVIHELNGDEYTCSYRYRRQKQPYRYFDAKVQNFDGTIVLKNPVHDIVFNMQGGTFVTKSTFEKNGLLYINEAYLGRGHYHVKDQGFDLKTGKQVWGLEDGRFYEFDRTLAYSPNR